MSTAPNPLDLAAPAVTERIQRRSLVIGTVAAVACLVGAFLQPAQFFRSWLLGYMLWIGITLGCLALLLVQHLTGGRWGFVTRRIYEAATRNLPLMALLFLPLLFGLGHLYEWRHDPGFAHDPALRTKASYLAAQWFVLRAIVYFATWLVLAFFLNRWSEEQDRAPRFDPAIRLRFQHIAGAGAVVYGFTVSFAAIDWVMSLDPHWFSTIYGLLFIAGQLVSAMGFTIAISALLAKHKPMDGILAPDILHDLGKLLLAFVLLWAYFSYSQFLIIWAGNLPEEIPWYLGRTKDAFRIVAFVLIMFHFALPFVLLLSRDLKRSARRLMPVAVLLIAMRYLDLFWLIAPNHVPGAGGKVLVLSWMDLAAPLAIGGLWLAAFFWNLRKRPLVPLNDPLFNEVVRHEHAG